MPNTTDENNEEKNANQNMLSFDEFINKLKPTLTDAADIAEKTKVTATAATISSCIPEKNLDLSSDQDLTVAIMHLVGIEEHLFFTGAKTAKSTYYDLIKEVRDIRKVLLRKLVNEYEGEIWCISKHLLAASYRLIEVGCKVLDQEGRKNEAYDFFNQAYNLYSLFWGIKLKLISTKDLTKIDDQSLNKCDTENKGILAKLKDIVRRAIDCCIE